MATLVVSLHLFAGAVSIPIASGASVSTIQTAISNAVTAGDSDITLQFAKDGVWGTSASSDITIAVPAGVTKLTLTYDPATSGATPLLYLNTLTYSDGLMTGGVTFDGLKLVTSVASRYLLSPTSTNTPLTYIVKNCYLDGYRAVLFANTGVTINEVLITKNIIKNINASGVVSTANSPVINKITIRQNTIINSGGITTSDYFIDHRSTNYASTVFNFSQNTVYSPATVGRGFFRLPGSPTAGNYKLNNNLFAPSVAIELRMGYGTYTDITTDADSTNYYSSNYTAISRTSSMVFTEYAENSPSNLFFNAAAEDFTINDPNFVGKNTAGDPRWFPAEVTAPVTLSTAVSPVNSGSVTPSSATVNSGSSLMVTATNNFGYSFKEWRDGDTNNLLSTDNPYTFTISANTSLVAIYDVLTTYDFTVNVAGSMWGTVNLNPEPTGGKYEAGTVVSMSAVNDSVSTFESWTDASTDQVRYITVDGDKDFTATFTEKSFIAGWDLITPDPKNSRPGDYYSDVANKGIFSAYEPEGTPVNWLTYTANGTPCGLLWTTSTTTRRYFQATFSTLGYKDINVHSNMFAYNQFFYPGQKLQYSTNGTDFTDLASTTLTASTWKFFPATLPQSLNNLATVYLRWIADETTTPVGSGNDGTGISNIYIYATLISTSTLDKQSNNITGYKSGNILNLNRVPENSSIFVYSVTGKLLNRELNSGNTYSVEVSGPCIVKVVNKDSVQNLKFL